MEGGSLRLAGKCRQPPRVLTGGPGNKGLAFHHKAFPSGQFFLCKFFTAQTFSSLEQTKDIRQRVRKHREKARTVWGRSSY